MNLRSHKFIKFMRSIKCSFGNRIRKIYLEFDIVINKKVIIIYAVLLRQMECCPTENY